MKKRVGVVVVICLALAVAFWSQAAGPRAVRAEHPAAASSSPTAMPDLIVRQDVLAHSWIVREEDLPATFCSVQEGNVTPGERTLLRFTVSTPNIGNADLDLGDPNAHVAAGDGLYEFATCHRHFHFRHYTFYQLIDPTTGFVWQIGRAHV